MLRGALTELANIKREFYFLTSFAFHTFVGDRSGEKNTGSPAVIFSDRGGISTLPPIRENY